MSTGEIHHVRRLEMPCDLPGARLWRFDGGVDNLYVPYFYNPPLDPNARHMIVVGNRGHDEQVCLLDLEGDTLTQLTAANGSDQHWSPYIRENVAGIRPQFIAWSQPNWEHVLYWEGNRLRRVHAHTLADETLFELSGDRVPAVPHCSARGWVAWGYLPVAHQHRLQQGASVHELQETLTHGCGICIYDLDQRELVLDMNTPFWPNHVAVSPDHRWVLYCHEGLWSEQRMYLYNVDRAESRPLRPQDDGASIGHEFWISPTVVGYHGAKEGRGFFGTVDVESGARTERPSPSTGSHHYGHYHVSPDGKEIVTDGEVTGESISISPLDSAGLSFQPVCRHNWAREQDQRYHPHPHWHQSGRFITFTGCEQRDDGAVRSFPCLLELPGSSSFAPVM